MDNIDPVWCEEERLPVPLWHRISARLEHKSGEIGEASALHSAKHQSALQRYDAAVAASSKQFYAADKQAFDKYSDTLVVDDESNDEAWAAYQQARSVAMLEFSHAIAIAEDELNSAIDAGWYEYNASLMDYSS